MRISPRGLAAVAATAAIPIGVLGAGTAFAAPDHQGAPAHGNGAGYSVATVLSGQSLSHTFTTASGKSGTEHLASPDDITTLGGLFYATFQNGVGPQGQAAEIIERVTGRYDAEQEQAIFASRPWRRTLVAEQTPPPA